MHGKTFKVIVFVGALGSVSGCPESEDDTEAFVGCRSDVDCKGERICSGGMCVDDSAEPSTEPSPGSNPFDPDPEGPDSGEPDVDLPGSSGGACTGNETMCSGPNSVGLCVEGTFETVSCTDFCGYYGFASDGCSGDFCTCGEPLDAQCMNGTSAVCACVDGCENEAALNLYVACYMGDAPEVRCAAGHLSGNSVDCQGVASCF